MFRIAWGIRGWRYQAATRSPERADRDAAFRFRVAASIGLTARYPMSRSGLRHLRVIRVEPETWRVA